MNWLELELDEHRSSSSATHTINVGRVHESHTMTVEGKHKISDVVCCVWFFCEFPKKCVELCFLITIEITSP